MDKSIQDISDVKKYGVYLYTMDLYNNGLSLMPITVTDSIVAGIRTTTSKMIKFNMRRSIFETLCHNRVIEFVEIAPREVQKEMNRIFNEKTIDFEPSTGV